MSWTDDRVALLKKLWGEGKTAAEIAKELGGVTRNAVIGKAHRLKLSNRVSPIQQNKKPVAAPKAPAEKKLLKSPVIAQDENREKVSLMDLGARMCRWPIGDPREESFGFCGCASMAGLPYCGEHAKVAYQAATRNRILKAEEQEVRAAMQAREPQPALRRKAANQ
jgi:GcrA cell cycle regulator